MSYPERIQFYALYKYINKYGQNENVNDWIRIIRNLTENTIIDEPSDYIAALKSVHRILDYGNAIVTFISDLANEIKGFSTIQIEEERIKALLMLKNNNWKQAIVTIENHAYFKGQVGFLLSFSGITKYYKETSNLNWPDQNDKVNIEKFIEYSEKANLIFNDNGLNKFDDYLFQRALLCVGDYTLSKGWNESFLVNNDRDIGWKRLLRDDNEKRKYLKILFDSIKPTQIEQDLTDIINKANITDWRKYFIEYPEMIEACGWRKFFRYNSDDDILLLETKQTNGYHSEYYSYSLYIKLRRLGYQTSYHKDNSVDYDKYISGINGKNINIQFKYYNGQYQYVIKYKGTTNNYLSQDEVITFLEENNIIT
jgi:hypothetical protein